MNDDVAFNNVRRTLRALELLARRPRSQAELARELQVHSRTARRLLGSLVAEGYVARDERVRAEFTPTLKLVALAGEVMARVEITDVASPFVSQLAHRADAIAHLSVPDNAQVMRLLEAGRSDSVRGGSQVGYYAPYHASAAGKAILAYLPLDASRMFNESQQGPGVGDEPDLPGVLVELAQVRDCGYAVDSGGAGLAVGSVAAPVFDHTGRVVAALGISAAAATRKDDTLATAVGIVLDVAQSLSEKLGFDRTSRAGRTSGTTSLVDTSEDRITDRGSRQLDL